MTCTRCEGTGFLNTQQLPDGIESIEQIQKWIADPANHPHDVTVCDCCGDGENWYGEPGEHFKTQEDQAGPRGPYAYNGGLPECN